jgi:acyl-CoA thioesterase FadM
MPCSKFNFRYEVFRKEENDKTTLIAQGYNSLAFVDIKTNRPIRPPVWMTKILFEKLGK